MAKPSDSLMREFAFFHSNSKLLTKEGQYVFESEHASGHVTLLNDVLAQEIPYFADQSELDDWMGKNPGILKKYDKVSLTEIKSSITGQPVTDKQSWYIEDGGNWMKPIIVGSLATNSANKPSSVLDPILYREDDSQVPSTQGVWWIDPFQGVLRFGFGYEPNKAEAYGGIAIGTPKLTCYVYTGSRLKDVIKTINDIIGSEITKRDYVYESSDEKLEHIINHDLNSTSLVYSMYEQDESSNWVSTIAGFEYIDLNSAKVTLAAPRKLKVAFRKVD